MTDENILQQWGQLLPQGGIVTEIFSLKQEMHTLGRKGDLKIDNPKVSSTHCRIRFNRTIKKAFLSDLSSNGTYIFDKKLAQNEETLLHQGDIIYLLRDKKIWIGYIFNLVDIDAEKEEDKQKQEILNRNELKQKEADEEVKTMQEELQLKLKQIKDENDLFEKENTCVVCIDLLYNPYVIIPCLHNYCCDCMTELTKQPNMLCPQCRTKPESIQKNYPLKNMIDAFIKKNPEKKWSQELLQQKDQKNELKPEYLNKINKKLLGKDIQVRNLYKNDSSSESQHEEEEDDDMSDEEIGEFQFQLQNRGNYQNMFVMPAHLMKCRECEQEREEDKFKCSNYQVHIRCQNCDTMMAQRNDNQVHPQSCTICEKSYCNLYFNADCQSKYNSLVNYHLKTFSDLPIPPTITAAAFGNKLEELNILEDHLQDAEIRTMIIYDHMSENFVKKGKFKYEISKKYMRSIFEKSFDIEMDTPICLQCWPNVWNQLVLKYAIDIRKELPQNIQNKPDCWFGVNCHSKVAFHLQRYNHSCPQTK